MNVIRTLINLYIVVIMIDAILSFFPESKKWKWAQYVRSWSNFICRPIREKITSKGMLYIPVDLSYFLAILILKLLMILW